MVSLPRRVEYGIELIMFVDTIAGQMRTLKSGGIPGGAKPKRRRANDEESSDGSDTEGDVDSESETDTDTDTDEE